MPHRKSPRKNPFRGLSLKEMLARAPLKGVELTRPKDYGRDIDMD
jgi:hypothetical protein